MLSRHIMSALFAVLAGLLIVLPANGQEKAPPSSKSKVILTPMSPREQQTYLNGLLPPKKRVGPISAYLVVSNSAKVNNRTACAGGAFGTASPSYAQPGGFDVHTDTNTLCHQLYDLRNRTVLGIPDSLPPHAMAHPLPPGVKHETGHLIFMACTSGLSKKQKALALSTMGYGALFEHKHPCLMQEGPVVRVVLGREKHGQWDVGVGTFKRLGGKVKVSEYGVVKVEKFEVVKLQH